MQVILKAILIKSVICYIELERLQQGSINFKEYSFDLKKFDSGGFNVSRGDKNSSFYQIALQVQNQQPVYVAYCLKKKDEIYSIFKNEQTIQNYIESGKTDCEFNYAAGKLGFNTQIITLVPDDLTINKQFNQYKLEQSIFSIYVYSQQYATYTLTLNEMNANQCFKNCNNQGDCSIIPNSPPLCECPMNSIGQSCSENSIILLESFSLKVLLEQIYNQMEMLQKSQQLFSIELKNKENLNNLILEINTSNIIKIQQFCDFDNQLKSIIETTIEQTIDKQEIPISQDNVRNCKQAILELNQNYNLNFTAKYLILIANPQNEEAVVLLKLRDNNILSQNIVIIIFVIQMLCLGGVLLFCCSCIKNLHETKEPQRTPQNVIEEQNSVVLINQKCGRQSYKALCIIYPGLREHQNCQICLSEFQDFDDVRLTNCLHLFHLSCLYSWLKINKTCPFCRDSITYSQLTRKINDLKDKWIERNQDYEQEKINQLRLQRLNQLKQASIGTLQPSSKQKLGNEEKFQIEQHEIESLDYIEDNL